MTSAIVGAGLKPSRGGIARAEAAIRSLAAAPTLPLCRRLLFVWDSRSS